MTDSKDIKALAKLMVEHDLTELEILEKDGRRLTLKHHVASAAVQAMTPIVAPAPIQAPQALPALAESAAPAPRKAEDDQAGLVAFKSPMVGTFYASSSPQAKPLVSVGDRIKPETTLCIIEAMKVFNEVKAETSGTLVKVLVTSGQAVEFGQPLFLIRP